ncbi:hypothetical protein Goarm_005260, partial [Gossypium armourianum]|nr:hypothetical protein [Gossypium armourianum]
RENFHKERIEEADDINLLEGDVTIDVVDEIPIDRVQSLVKKRMLRCSSSSYLAEGSIVVAVSTNPVMHSKFKHVENELLKANLSL